MNVRIASIGAASLMVATASPAFAQDLSSEVGPTTVWFALLVVVFALLVAIGLYMAQDREVKSQREAPKSQRPSARSARQATSHPRGSSARLAQPEPERSRNKQQEFS